MPESPDREDAEETYYGETLCLDSWSGRRFRSSELDILNQIAAFKGHYLVGTRAFKMNDFFDLLNLEHSPDGYIYGYPGNRKNKANLDIHLEWDKSYEMSDEPMLIIKYGKGSTPEKLLDFNRAK